MISGNLAQKLSVNQVASAMKALGFERMHAHSKRGYLVVAYSAEEIKANQRMLACEAKPENRDTRDTCDTVF